jgi:hypothetical protein
MESNSDRKSRKSDLNDVNWSNDNYFKTTFETELNDLRVQR